MSYFEFPHTRNYDGDLGYIIKKLIELTDKYDLFFAENKIKIADPFQWDISSQYEPYTVVSDSATEGVYISKKPVPAGININNTDYWEMLGPFSIDYSLVREFCETLINEKIDTSIFCVGSSCKYKTIKSAYEAVVANHGGTILIYPGVYDEAITMISGSDSYKIAFIGLSRNDCIWKSTAFGYDNACFTGSGNLTFENLTMQKGELAYTASTQGGYALHMDYPNTEGVMRVHNCTLISVENSALGCGTRTNQKIYIDDCFIYSTVSSAVSTNGALLYHSAPEVDQHGQSFSLKNSIILGLGEGSSALNIYNSGNNTETFELELINNRVMGDIFQQNPNRVNYWDAIVSTSYVTDNSELQLTIDKCFGNNHNKLNALHEEVVNQQTKLVTGAPIPVMNTLNPPILNGFIIIPSNSEDTPLSGHDHTGFIIGYGTGYYTYIVGDITTGLIYTKVIKNGSVYSNWSVSGSSIVLYGRNAHPVRYAKMGRLVSCMFSGIPCTTANTSWPIASGYRPEFNVYGSGYILRGSAMVLASIIVNTDGTYTFARADGAELNSNDTFHGNMSWFVA